MADASATGATTAIAADNKSNAPLESKDDSKCVALYLANYSLMRACV